MSLKGFHIFFIICSIVLCLFYGFWAFQYSFANEQVGYFMSAMLAVFLSVGLSIYTVTIAKKLLRQ